MALTWPYTSGASNYSISRVGSDGTSNNNTVPPLTIYDDLGLTNGVTYTYTVSAMNDAGTGPSSPAAKATPISGGLSGPDWFLGCLTEGGYFDVSSDNANPYVDGPSLLTNYAPTAPDGDQIPVLLKFATGFPLGVTSQTYPTTLGTYTPPHSTQTFLTLSFQRLNPGPVALVTYIVEASNDLVGWTPIATLNEGTSNWGPSAPVQESASLTDPSTLINDVVTDTTPISTTSSAHRYLRLRVKVNTP